MRLQRKQLGHILTLRRLAAEAVGTAAPSATPAGPSFTISADLFTQACPPLSPLLSGSNSRARLVRSSPLRKSPDACLNRIRRALNLAEQNLEVVPVSASVKTKLGRSGLQVQL
jgi:hypothetical protein